MYVLMHCDFPIGVYSSPQLAERARRDYDDRFKRQAPQAWHNYYHVHEFKLDNEAAL
jgi:hypothetical protein